MNIAQAAAANHADVLNVLLIVAADNIGWSISKGSVVDTLDLLDDGTSVEEVYEVAEALRFAGVLDFDATNSLVIAKGFRDEAMKARRLEAVGAWGTLAEWVEAHDGWRLRERDLYMG